jgi:hypothetical protein
MVDVLQTLVTALFVLEIYLCLLCDISRKFPTSEQHIYTLRLQNIFALTNRLPKVVHIMSL